jgi:DNA primase
MITQQSIQQVKDAIQVADVIEKLSKYKLQKRGSILTGLCPFHDEKTPSFTVSPSKGIYKCFGCGISGDGLKFIMEHEHMNFIEAIKWAGDFYRINLEEEKITEEEKRERKQKDVEVAMLYKLNEAAARQWHKQLYKPYETESGIQISHSVELDYLLSRKISIDSIVQWCIGWSPDEWRFLTPTIIEKGLWKQAEALGLVRHKNEQNYDAWRGRIMFPIHDEKGNIVAFGGRSLLGNDEMKKQGIPKYLNSSNNDIYNKRKVLYGLYFAKEGIKQHKFAILTEGYTDVICFHQMGANNTVATCGTALTDNQAKLLKKYCDHVVIARDGDNAGMKASMEDIDTLLEHGFKVEILPMPEGKDPADYSCGYQVASEYEMLIENSVTV